MAGNVSKVIQAPPISERPAMADKPRFQVRMVGTNVSPETVRATDLAEFVTLIAGAIAAADPGAGSAEALDEAIVSLVRIEEGSSKLTFAKAYLAHLFESGVKLVLPTPALAEYLIGIPSEDHERTRLVLERNFLMAPLSAKAAQVAAQLLQAVDTRRMRAQHPVDRQSLRVDALIIGIAIDLQTSDGKAAKVVTYDLKHFRQLA